LSQPLPEPKLELKPEPMLEPKPKPELKPKVKPEPNSKPKPKTEPKSGPPQKLIDRFNQSKIYAEKEYDLLMKFVLKSE
jgi:hypothetical protein